MRCLQICDKIQDMNIWDLANTGARTTISVCNGQKLNESDCTLCGQCVVNCPVGALRERDDVGKALEAVEDKDIITVVQIAPAMIAEQLQMVFCRISCALIGGVALYHRAAHMTDHRLPKFRTKEILIALFTGVDLDGYIAGQVFADYFQQFQNFFRGDDGGEINLGGHNRASYILYCTNPVYLNVGQKATASYRQELPKYKKIPVIFQTACILD